MSWELAEKSGRAGHSAPWHECMPWTLACHVLEKDYRHAAQGLVTGCKAPGLRVMEAWSALVSKGLDVSECSDGREFLLRVKSFLRIHVDELGAACILTEDKLEACESVSEDDDLEPSLWMMDVPIFDLASDTLSVESKNQTYHAYQAPFLNSV